MSASAPRCPSSQGCSWSTRYQHHHLDSIDSWGPRGHRVLPDRRTVLAHAVLSEGLLDYSKRAELRWLLDGGGTLVRTPIEKSEPISERFHVSSVQIEVQNDTETATLSSCVTE